MDMTHMIPKGKEGRAADGDFKKEDGMWYCGKCGKRRQRNIEFGGVKKTVWCLCDCEVAELEKSMEQEKYEDQMRRVSVLKNASMMDEKYKDASFLGYRIRKDNEKAYKIAGKYVEDFLHMEEKHQGLLLYGPIGTGKSFTAACIANALMEKQISVVMTSFVKILQDIGNYDNEAEYIAMLNTPRLLIIDDLGAERGTDYALEKVYNVIDSRVRTDKPLILTTNLMFGEMMQCQDLRYRRIYDRILEVCYPVAVPGKSFRIMEAAERQKEMNKLFE